MNGAGEETIAAHARRRASGPAVTLFSSWFCPYAQRAWVALEEAGVDYHWREIQPYLLDDRGEPTKNPKSIEQKSAEFPEFVQCSPTGLVPALMLSPPPASGAAPRINESLDVVEYVDTHYARGRMGSAEAAVKQGIAVVESSILPFFYRLLMEQGDVQRDAATAAILDGLLKWVAARPTDTALAGPFFLGDRFSAADIALLPWFPQRLEWIAGAYRGFHLPETWAFRPLVEFSDAVRSRPSVQRTIVDRTRLVANYSYYADGSATSTVAKTVARM
jgi:glutathione S-transferase